MAVVLPRGWEVKRDPDSGWPYYIDHNTGTTTWNDPRLRKEMPYAGFESNYWYPTGPQAGPYPSNYSQMMDHQMPPQGLVNGVFSSGRAPSPRPVQGNAWYPPGPAEHPREEPITSESHQQQPYRQHPQHQQNPTPQAGLPRPPSNGNASSAQWAYSQTGPPNQGLLSRPQAPTHQAYSPAQGQRELYDQQPHYPVTPSQYPFGSPGTAQQQALYPPQHQPAQWQPSMPASALPTAGVPTHDPWAQVRVPAMQSSAEQFTHPMSGFGGNIVSGPSPGWQRVDPPPSVYDQKDIPYSINHQDPLPCLNNANFPGNDQQPAGYLPPQPPDQLPGTTQATRMEYSAPPTVYKVHTESKGGREKAAGAATDEGTQPAECPVHPGQVKVEQVMNNVQQLEAEVNQFDGKRGDKTYRLLEELLTKQLLEVDSVETNGQEHIRQVRKAAVHKIQSVLEKLERIAR
ncbi:BAG family molecular chaperone regulator 3-like [Leucoraja erinacea]|uniref:BAG family molecular chaperone regulator 3-like n=1 Tax=Leucoraja erinaceus TaxID=7782 RepID=UPI002457417B|nr:BAG family molecular chaperone regulator 3-like [Leucoraja erinacea]